MSLAKTCVNLTSQIQSVHLCMAGATSAKLLQAGLGAAGEEQPPQALPCGISQINSTHRCTLGRRVVACSHMWHLL